MTDSADGGAVSFEGTVSGHGEEEVLRLDQVSFGYPGERLLFSMIDLTLAAGGFYLLRGPSGTGKSTLLRLMNRLDEPIGGSVFFNGTAVSSIPPPELRRSILYIHQTPVVLDGTVRDNLLFPYTFRANRFLVRPDDAVLEQMLKTFNLDSIVLDKNARNLSVGQQQRLCLIRGMLLDPAVILLDEPTSALDEESAGIVEACAERLCSSDGKTVVMAHHRPFTPGRVLPRVIRTGNGTAVLEKFDQAAGTEGRLQPSAGSKPGTSAGSGRV